LRRYIWGRLPSLTALDTVELLGKLPSFETLDSVEVEESLLLFEPLESVELLGRGLHSFPFQLNLSSSVYRIIQLNSCMCTGVAHVEL